MLITVHLDAAVARIYGGGVLSGVGGAFSAGLAGGLGAFSPLTAALALDFLGAFLAGRRHLMRDVFGRLSHLFGPLLSGIGDHFGIMLHGLAHRFGLILRQ